MLSYAVVYTCDSTNTDSTVSLTFFVLCLVNPLHASIRFSDQFKKKPAAHIQHQKLTEICHCHISVPVIYGFMLEIRCIQPA